MTEEHLNVPPYLKGSKDLEGIARDTDAKIEVKPELVSFFASSEISVTSFFRAIKKSEKKRFLNEDKTSALELMRSSDKNGERIWALISQSQLPEPIDAWIWSAVQTRLSDVLGNDFDPQQFDSTKILTSIVNKLRLDLKSENEEIKKQSENWFRISVCWLIEKKNLRSWDVASKVFSIVFPDDQKASDLSTRVIARGKKKEFEVAVAMSGLGDEKLQTTLLECMNLKQALNELDHRHRDLRNSFADRKLENEALRAELVVAHEKIADIEKKFADERQHWAHDISATKADQEVLLKERIVPYLTDAIDALEIEPPVPHVALGRLKSLCSIIKDENQ